MKLDQYLPHEAHYAGYVSGFYFSEDLKQVILIQKTHPEFQAGKLNGIGGKIENGESHQSAMTREFLEEAGVKVHSWRYLGAFNARGKPVHVFCQKGDISRCSTQTDEQLVIFNLEQLDDAVYVYSFVPGVLALIITAKNLLLNTK